MAARAMFIRSTLATQVLIANPPGYSIGCHKLKALVNRCESTAKIHIRAVTAGGLTPELEDKIRALPGQVVPLQVDDLDTEVQCKGILTAAAVKAILAMGEGAPFRSIQEWHP